MDRGEASALGIAAAGHVVLFGLLSVGFLASPNPELLKPRPIEVVLADEVDLTSASPEISTEAPAERLAAEEGPVTPPPPEATPAPPTPAPPAPAPVEAPAPRVEPAPAPPRATPRPTPAPRRPAPEARPQPPRPAPAERASPRPAPAAAQPKARPTPARPTAQPKAAPTRPTAQRKAAAPARTASNGAATTASRVRPTGRLSGITDGLADRPAATNSTRAQASQTAAQARRSISVAIGQSIRPYWRPPTGADADQLVSVLQFNLNEDGSLAGTPRLVEQRGQTESNTPQQPLHVERAIRAIRAAAPFSLPPEHYDQWKTWRLEFDARLR